MNVYRSLHASRFLPRLSGAAPYKLSTVSIKFSRFGQLWSLITFPIAATFIYLHRNDTLNEIGDMKTLLLTISTWLQFFIAAFGVLKDGFFQQDIIRVVQSMDNYDKTTGYGNNASTRRETERVRLNSFMYSVLLIALAAGRCLVEKILHLDPASEILAMQIDNSIHMFSVLTTLLGLRIRHLNSMLKQGRSIKIRSLGSETIANAEYVRVLYTDLVAIGDQLNNHYSSRLFLWSCLTTLVLIARLYYMLMVGVSAMFFTATVIQVLPTVFGLLFFSLACQFTAEQMNRITAVVLEKSIRHTVMIDRGRKEIFTMSLYMMLRNFEFTALGFFTVDLALVYAIVGTTVTYLTFCLQWGSS